MTEATERIEPLWGGLPIPHIGVTGPYNSGKTLFGLSINPRSTLNIDLEDSSATFSATMPIKKRVSMYEELGKKNGSKVPSEIEAFIWFRDTIESVKPGEFQVCFVDPINDIEIGLENLIRQNPQDFGLSKNQLSNAPGLLWAAMNRYWKFWLGNMSAKFDSFVFAAHLGNVWKGGKPVEGKKKAKGKSVLMELASLYLELKREVNKDGITNSIPTGFPYGDLGKERLAVWHDATAQMVSVLPPRIEQCTPDRIREFIANPVGLRALTDAEKLPPEQPMSEEEKLRLQVEISENQRAVEEAKLLTMETVAEARRKNEQQQQASQDKQKDSQDKQDLLVDIEAAGQSDEKVRLVDMVSTMFNELGVGKPGVEASCEKRGGKTLYDLSMESLEELRVALDGKLKAKAEKK